MKQQRADKSNESTETPSSTMESTSEATEKLKDLPCIVAIGSSAGGVEALQEFFSYFPVAPGIAFVVVHHFAHDAITHLPELLAKKTTMPVTPITQDMQVEAGHVYIIAPGTLLSIENGVLLPAPANGSKHTSATIDPFLRSLAEDQHERAICIILSGSGSDGTLGMKAIEAAGGMTIVQDPDTAAHSAMPRSAIRTGIVDYVLPIGKMSEVMLRYAAHPYVRQNGDTVAADRESDHLITILALLRARLGYNFGSYKKNTIMRRIQRRMGLKHIETLPEYARYLRDNREEVSGLFQDLLICVTDFFRDPEAWQILKEDVIKPLIHECNGNASIRVWIPGCATGEEAYSVAMLLIEQVRATQKNCTIQIFASDINPAALETARAGIYPSTIAEDIPPDYLHRFFTEIPNDHHYQINKQVRESIVFAEQNLISDPPFSKLDLICCRNVLIYLEPDVQRKIISLFHFALRSKGYMFLGSAESITQHEELFRPISKKWRIYQRTGDTRRDVMAFPVIKGDSTANEPRTMTPHSDNGKIATVAQQILLERYSPASVLINRKMEILYFSGPTHDYLINPTGTATHDLLAMAREGLRSKLRAAIQQAIHEEQTVTVREVRVKRGKSFHPVQIAVTPLTQLGKDGLLLIVFEERDGTAITQEAPQPEPLSSDDTVIRQLEYDLKVMREDLQSNIEELETSNEELKAANEEVMSVNEELQSTNEELETSKEELQSLNEELTTVNHQLQAKVEELEQTNNDLHNLLISTEIATIFLDNRLCIMRFTPAMTRLMHLIPSDIGRPISVFAQRFTEQSLIDDARQVLQKLTPVETEVLSDNRRWYIRRTLPYRTEDNRIEGVVITFIDITERRQTEQALAEAEERYRMVVDMARDYAIFRLDLQGNVTSWNIGAERVLGWSEQEMTGQQAAIIYTPEDRDHGVFEHELRTAATDGVAIDERWHLRKDGSRFWAVGRMMALHDEGGRNYGFSKVMRDTTTQKKLGIELQELTETLEQRIHDRTAHAEQLAGDLRALSAEQMLDEDRERRQLAADLHDELGQTLTLIKMRLAGLRQIETGSDATSHASPETSILELERLVSEAIRSVRSVTFQLSPPILHELGLVPALQWLGDEMGKQYTLVILVEDDGTPKQIDEKAAFMLFRSVRELLINVAKHAEATRATVDIRRRDGNLIIQVSDNGKGFDVEAVTSGENSSGYGVFSTRERLSYLGGSMKVQSAPGIGTVVTLTVPLVGEQPEQDETST